MDCFWFCVEGTVNGEMVIGGYEVLLLCVEGFRVEGFKVPLF